MKFLLDMPVSPLLLEVITACGHDGVHAFQIGLDRAPDEELLELARVQGRVIVTADLDFPRLLAHISAEKPGVVLFRGGNYSNTEMCDLLKRVLTAVPPATLETSVCVVDAKHIRITLLPLGRKIKSEPELES